WFVINLPFSFTTPFLQDIAKLDLLMIGVLGSVTAVGGALLSPLIGRIADKQGTQKILGIGFLVIAVAYTLQVTWPTVAILGLAFFLRGGASSISSLMTSIVSQKVNVAAIGISFAVFNLATGLSSTIAPYLAGYLYTSNPRLPFQATIVLALLLGTYFLVTSGESK
ncbi:MAG: MFS transporter, partial [bacterium]|nr:MFS transporter [bacterium]